MKIYKKIILDSKNKILLEDSYEYKGKFSIAMGIHYNFASTKSAKLMEKKEKKRKKLVEKKKKRQAKLGIKTKEEPNTTNIDIPLSLEEITNPNKNKR